MILTAISSGVVIAPFVSRYVKSADLGVHDIVPSTWLKDKGTGVKECYSTLAISIIVFNMYKMLPNKSRIKRSGKTFLSDVVIFCFVVFCLPFAFFCHFTFCLFAFFTLSTVFVSILQKMFFPIFKI